MGGCIIDLVSKNDSLYLLIAMFSYKWVTLYAQTDHEFIVFVTAQCSAQNRDGIKELCSQFLLEVGFL